jgi:hypothetical protein
LVIMMYQRQERAARDEIAVLPQRREAVGVVDRLGRVVDDRWRHGRRLDGRRRGCGWAGLGVAAQRRQQEESRQGQAGDPAHGFESLRDGHGDALAYLSFQVNFSVCHISRFCPSIMPGRKR